jgi:hypothetical protein
MACIGSAGRGGARAEGLGSRARAPVRRPEVVEYGRVCAMPAPAEMPEDRPEPGSGPSPRTLGLWASRGFGRAVFLDRAEQGHRHLPAERPSIGAAASGPASRRGRARPGASGGTREVASGARGRPCSGKDGGDHVRPGGTGAEGMREADGKRPRRSADGFTNTRTVPWP